MIRLTRLNHQSFLLNSDRIEHVESTPDTVIVMDNGQQFIVRETADELVAKVLAFRREIGPDILTNQLPNKAKNDAQNNLHEASQ